jgi:hypothetical protein
MNTREKIITFYVELNRALSDPKWTSLSSKDARHLRNSINTMTLDVMNGEMFTIAAETSLSWLRSKTSIDIPALRTLLLRPPQKYQLIRKLTIVEADDVINFVLKYTEIDDMIITVPTEIARSLIGESNITELTKLVERYYILQPDGGFFWSAPPQLYQSFMTKDTDCIEVIEGFGSPFNHNSLDQCCSLYNDDKSFGMISNFFAEITNRGNLSESGYRRWVINPPVTFQIMNMIYDAISVRMNSFPNDEYYFLLPDWAPYNLINLLEVRGTVERLTGGCYHIYNHLTREYITPSNNLIFASTIPNDSRVSGGLELILTHEAQTPNAPIRSRFN